MTIKSDIILMLFLWSKLEFSKENVYEHILGNTDLKNLITKNNI